VKWYCRHCDVMKRTKGLEPPDREETRCPHCFAYMQPANFKPSKGIARKPKTKPSRPIAVEAAILIAKAEWVSEVRNLPCAVCGKRCGVTRGHHVLYQQWLESVAKTLGIDFELLLQWDKRNRLPVGDRCHKRHHDAIKRIPRSVLVKRCPAVFDMARELGNGLERRLDETYPDRAQAAA
jgi:hypothetical protein